MSGKYDPTSLSQVADQQEAAVREAPNYASAYSFLAGAVAELAHQMHYRASEGDASWLRNYAASLRNAVERSRQYGHLPVEGKK